MTEHGSWRYLDALYGDVTFSTALSMLVRTPAVQRLRDIRLSNIPSLSMPGISNISRFEHVLGAAYLASRIAPGALRCDSDATRVQAAALLHDAAIAPYGHLVEEAFQYRDVLVDHESKWMALYSEEEMEEPAGVDVQLNCGRKSGISQWARKTFGSSWQDALEEIFSATQGKGVLGSIVASDMDVDNLDNVTRAAYHMGISFDKSLPVRVIAGIVSVGIGGRIEFLPECLPAISEWIDLRRQVYERFMLSRADFAGKVMVLSASVAALDAGELRARDWMMTDQVFTQRLLASSDTKIRDTIQRWLLGDLWDLSELLWVEGDLPARSRLANTGKAISDALKRECFVYGIKDKRKRVLRIVVSGNCEMQLGSAAGGWLVGVGSHIRKEFGRKENKLIAHVISESFSSPSIPMADPGQGRMFSTPND